MSQTWSNVEIVIVDDGSIDDTVSIIRRINNKKIRIYEQENRGASAARNRGLQESRGDYIQYLDADDILHPEKIKAQLEVCEANPGFVSYCQWQPFQHEIGDLPLCLEGGDTFVSKYDYFNSYLNNTINLLHCCHLIPRAIAERAGKWDESLTLNDDGEYAARVVAASSGLVPAGLGPLYYYRKHKGSLSSVNSHQKVLSGIKALDKIVEISAANGVDIMSKKLARNYFNLMVAGYPYSESYISELEERISHYGGYSSQVIIGGKAANKLAAIIGWKAARRLQRMAGRN